MKRSAREGNRPDFLGIRNINKPIRVCNNDYSACRCFCVHLSQQRLTCHCHRDSQVTSRNNSCRADSLGGSCLIFFPLFFSTESLYYLYLLLVATSTGTDCGLRNTRSILHFCKQKIRKSFRNHGKRPLKEKLGIVIFSTTDRS
jgi:hypothetical protein